MTGDNVTSSNAEDWRKASNKNIADNLVQSIGELLDGEVKHYIVVDRNSSYKKIVIEYDHSSTV